MLHLVMALSGREPMTTPSRWIVLSDAVREELEQILRASTLPAGLSRRARVVLLLAAGGPLAEVAVRTGYTRMQVHRLRTRFLEAGVAGLLDRPRSGRPPTISARKRAQVVALTLKRPPSGLTHWTTRDLAREAKVSHMTVYRLWRAHALQPHRVQTFKFTTD